MSSVVAVEGRRMLYGDMFTLSGANGAYLACAVNLRRDGNLGRGSLKGALDSWSYFSHGLSTL